MPVVLPLATETKLLVFQVKTLLLLQSPFLELVLQHLLSSLLAPLVPSPLPLFTQVQPQFPLKSTLSRCRFEQVLSLLLRGTLSISSQAPGSLPLIQSKILNLMVLFLRLTANPLASLLPQVNLPLLSSPLKGCKPQISSPKVLHQVLIQSLLSPNLPHLIPMQRTISGLPLVLNQLLL